VTVCSSMHPNGAGNEAPQGIFKERPPLRALSTRPNGAGEESTARAFQREAERVRPKERASSSPKKGPLLASLPTGAGDPTPAPAAYTAATSQTTGGGTGGPCRWTPRHRGRHAKVGVRLGSWGREGLDRQSPPIVLYELFWARQ